MSSASLSYSKFNLRKNILKSEDKNELIDNINGYVAIVRIVEIVVVLIVIIVGSLSSLMQ